ncbi:hypothetical protein [Bradyrhizobium jicamae]|uniref:hypothetical protein n=1 Tax=Bradyrhizobium jicamae TaxID=280332 RepID=UPI001BADD8E0|nr:hypothetical protein [Bradyrhizobium jicamae]MBR0934861.1 hypothetical protein [Bradyrhizobium jicamae]
MNFGITIDTFLSGLLWLDGQPLVVEPYRLDIFKRTFAPDSAISMVLAGRGKKNSKSLDLILAALYCLLFADAPQGNDVLLVANDAGQAGDDLDLAKKLIEANPDLLAADLECFSDQIRRKDGRGTMRVLASGNAIGQHGKTGVFIGYDEIHGFTDWDLLEALQPDPTRYCLQWITSYDSVFDTEGCPLHDLKKIGIDGTDQSMLFSWYSADLCTDPAFAELEPDLRANPSLASWPDGRAYLDRQRRRLPSAKFRRLHHNLPGAPQGTFFDQGKVEAAIVAGRRELAPEPGVDYLAAIDMSGGSSDDAVLSISHWNPVRRVAVQDVLVDQGEPTPFNPRLFVGRAAAIARKYRCRQIHGDAYAGEVFRCDFADHGLDYVVTDQTATEFYESLEVALNAGQVELLDQSKLRRQLLTLIRKGASITHPGGQHDDHANASAIAMVLVNPEIGADAEPGMLGFMRQQVERKVGVAQYVDASRCKIVTVKVPMETSHVMVGGVAYLVRLNGDARTVELPAPHALELLEGPLSPFRSANAELLQVLQDRAKLENYKHSRLGEGIKVADLLQAQRDARPTVMDEMQAVHRAKWGLQ